MSEYLKLFEMLASRGRRPDVQGPNLDDWYTHDVALPGEQQWQVDDYQRQAIPAFAPREPAPDYNAVFDRVAIAPPATTPSRQKEYEQVMQNVPEVGPTDPDFSNYFNRGDVTQQVQSAPAEQRSFDYNAYFDDLASRRERDWKDNLLRAGSYAAAFLTSGPFGAALHGPNIEEYVYSKLDRDIPVSPDAEEEVEYGKSIREGWKQVAGGVARGLETATREYAEAPNVEDYDLENPYDREEYSMKLMEARRANPALPLDKIFKSIADLDALQPDEDYHRRLNNKEGLTRYAEQVTGMAPQMASQVAAHILTGGIGSGVFMAFQIAGSEYNSIIKENPNIDPKRAAAAAWGSAAMQAPMEAISLKLALNNPLMRKIVLNKVAKFGLNRVMGAATEGITENLQEIPSEFWQRWAADPNYGEKIKENPAGELGDVVWTGLKEGVEPGAVGAFYGAILPGAAGKPNVLTNKDLQAISEEEFDLLSKDKITLEELQEKYKGKLDVNSIIEMAYRRYNEEQAAKQAIPAEPEQIPSPGVAPGEFTPEQIEAGQYFGLDFNKMFDDLAAMQQGPTAVPPAEPAPGAIPTPGPQEGGQMFAGMGEVADEAARQKLFQNLDKIADAVINEDVEPGVKIDSAALRYNGKVYTGANHGEAYQKIIDDIGDLPDAEFVNMDQGFQASDGRFVEREEALQIAERAGQAKEGAEGYLRAEDLKEDIDIKQLSPEMREWARGSVVGEEGVAYHATTEDFDIFDSRRGELGIHVGSPAQAADIVTKKIGGTVENARTMPLVAKAEKPIRLKDTGAFGPTSFLDQISDHPDHQDPDSQAKIAEAEEKLNALDDLFDDGGVDRWYSEGNKIMQNLLNNLGYDSAVYLNRGEGLGEGALNKLEEADFDPAEMTDEEFIKKFPEARDSWILFEPNQVKSAFNVKPTEKPGVMEDAVPKKKAKKAPSKKAKKKTVLPGGKALKDQYGELPVLTKPSKVQEKVIQAFHAVTGLKTKLGFFKNEGPYKEARGFHIGGNVFVREGVDVGWHTYMHETVHDLRTKFPELYQKLKTAIEPYIDNQKVSEYGKWLNDLRKARKKTELGADKIREEYIAQYLGVQARNKEFWKKLFESDYHLFDTMAVQAMNAIEKAGGTTQWDEVAQHYFKDHDKVLDIFAEVYREYWSDAGLIKPGKQGPVSAAQVAYAAESVNYNLDSTMINSLVKNEVLDDDTAKILDYLGEAGAIDDVLGAQLYYQKYATQEQYDKAKKKWEKAKKEYKGKDNAEKLAKAKAAWQEAEERFKRSKNMPRSEVAKIMTRDERPSYMNITTALKNNPKLKQRIKDLEKKANVSFFDENGNFRHHPIEERTKPDADKVFDVLPLFGGFRRSVAQTLIDNLDQKRKEAFRQKVIGWVETAHKKKLDPKLFGRKLSIIQNSEYAIAPAVRVASKTLGAINLNSMCPMFNVGNHGCYLDGCYLTAMGAGGNGVNFYNSSMYMGEILQMSNDDVKALNGVGGLRINGVGDTNPEHLPQMRDVFRHASMRNLKLKWISKQESSFEIIDKLQKDKDPRVRKAAKEVIIQPTVDPYWVPVTEDDLAGSMVDIYDMRKTAEKGNLEAVVKAYQDVTGREARVIGNQVYRKYGFSYDQLAEMSKKYKQVRVQPRLVVGTFKEIAEHALNTPEMIQTWMHAAVRPGMYSEVEGRVLQQGEIGNFTKRAKIVKDGDSWQIKATDAKGKVLNNAKTYDALTEFIRNEYSKSDQKKIFTALFGQNKKNPSALCCRAGANLDACMDCTSHCHYGTSYTGTRLRKLTDQGKKMGIFADPDVDEDVDDAMDSPEARAIKTVPEDFEKSIVPHVKRFKEWGVGKVTPDAVYVHAQYEDNIPNIKKYKAKLPKDFSYDYVKYNRKTNAVTFSESPDWATSDEPIVGNQILVREDGTTRKMSQQKDPWIIHHKWAFVKDDYKGFDVTQSKLRSLQWTALKDVEKGKIGKWSYWQENVVPRLGPVARTAADKKTVMSDKLKGQLSEKDLAEYGWEPWMQGVGTQRKGTKSTYEKIAKYLKSKGIEGNRILDFSAGMGIGTKVLKSDSYEPFPAEGFEPDFTEFGQITKKYDAVVNNVTLNVLAGDRRAQVIDEIASVLESDGIAIIAARDRASVMSVKNPQFSDDRTGEVLTAVRKMAGKEVMTYQKGYANDRELGEEIVSQLGSEYDYVPMRKEIGLSSPAVMIKKKSRNEVMEDVDPSSIWYSQMTNEFDKKLPKKSPAKAYIQQIESMARKGQIKQEELEYSGVIDWLNDQGQKVNKSDILEYLANNHVRVLEGKLSGALPDDINEALKDKGFREAFAKQLKTEFAEIYIGDEYEEQMEYLQPHLDDIDDLIKTNSPEAWDAVVNWADGWQLDAGAIANYVLDRYEDTSQYARYSDLVQPGGDIDYTELIFELPQVGPDTFYHDHWGDWPNVLAHARFNTRQDKDGNRILFIEEIQSDWHQEGRKRGYKGKGDIYDRIEALSQRSMEILNELQQVKNDAWDKWIKAAVRESTEGLTQEQARKMSEQMHVDDIIIQQDENLYPKYQSLGNEWLSIQRENDRLQYNEQVPDAPFKKTWPTLVLKRLVKYAADNGYDGIAWTNGDMQVERYNLARYVDKIYYEQNDDGTYEAVIWKNDKVLHEYTRLTEDQLENTFGKEASIKITEGGDQGQLEGDDLKVGGKGMRDFYDKMLPNHFNKFFNKATWGKAKISKMDIGSGFVIRTKSGVIEHLFETRAEAKDYIDNRSFGWINKYKPTIDTGKLGSVPGVIFPQELKSKASLEAMPMFDLDFQADAGDDIKKALESKIGRKSTPIGDRIRDALDDFWKNKTTRVVDRLAPIKEKLGGEGTAYMMHRGLPGVQSTLNAMFAHGKLKWKGDVITTPERNKGFLRWVKENGADSEKAFYWIMAKRAEVLEKEGRENWLTKPVRDMIFKWVGDPSGNKSWEQINKEFQEWNDSVLQLAVESGLLSKEQIGEWQRDFYIPFYRVFEDEEAKAEYTRGPHKGKINLSAQVRRLQGAEARIGDPYENIIRNWSHLVGESMANRARSEAYNFAVDKGIESGLTKIDDDGNEKPVPLIEDVKWSDTVIFKPQKGGITFVEKKTGEEILSFKQKGKTKFFRVNDPELFQALSLVNKSFVNNHLMRAMSGAKRALTAGATFGPAFRVANMIRDSLHTFQITKGMTFKPFWDTAKGFVSSWRQDQDFIEFMASGHAFGGSYVRADDPEAMAKYIKRIAKKENVSTKSVAKRVLDTPKKLLDFWERVGSASENAARVQLYKNLKREGKTDIEAAFAARDLMDFQMKGNSDVVGFLVATVPFLNARMQGLYRMGRAGVENPKTFLFKGGLIAAATMALWAINKDDERYKELEDWEKFAYYHFWIGDLHYRIPKPFETGVLFSTIWESVADVMYGNEDGKHLLDAATHAVGETFAFNPIPQAVRPAAEQWANKSFFTGRPIESQYQQKLKRGERYDPWTSPTLIMAGKLGIPPKRAESLIRGYFADIGMSLLWTADLFTRAFVDFPERPAKRIDEMPMIGRFVRQAEPQRSTKYMTKFWETMKELDEVVTTVNMYQRSGDMEGAIEIANKNRKLLQQRPALNKARQQIRKISHEIKRVWKDPNLTSEEKKDIIDKYYQQRNQYLRIIYDNYIKE